MAYYFNITVVIFTTVVCLSQSVRILGLFHTQSFSHYILGNALMKELAIKGHDVTIVSAFKEENPPKNYQQVTLTTPASSRTAWQSNMKELYHRTDTSAFSSINRLLKVVRILNEKVLQHPNVQSLIRSNATFDVVIIEQFINDAHKTFAHHFKAPLILFTTSGTNSWVNSLVGNPSPSAYIPNVFVHYESNMSFFQRLHNVFLDIYLLVLSNYYSYPHEERIMKEYFPNPPSSLDKLRKNVSLVLLSSHPSLNQAVPYVPNMIDIGGFHVKPSVKTLPPDLQKLLDDADDGVIYFSMGANLRSTDMDISKRIALLSAFSKLKEKVLWKWEEDELPGQPSNVILSKWFPQQDVLAHRNVKLFITHGGLLSTTETVYYGVPILIIPIFGDQKLNAASAENGGYGLSIPYAELTEEKLSKKLNELLKNPKYHENARKKSQLLHDQPVKPLDNAVYWVEYVIRHKGASHLRVAALDLPWYQYFLLDVICVLALTVFLLIFISYKIFKITVCRVIFSKTIEKIKRN